MANTPNYNLLKPSPTGTEDVHQSLSDNFTIIDTQMKANDTKAQSVKSEVEQARQTPDGATQPNLQAAIRWVYDRAKEETIGTEITPIVGVSPSGAKFEITFDDGGGVVTTSTTKLQRELVGISPNGTRYEITFEEDGDIVATVTTKTVSSPLIGVSPSGTRYEISFEDDGDLVTTVSEAPLYAMTTTEVIAARTDEHNLTSSSLKVRLDGMGTQITDNIETIQTHSTQIGTALGDIGSRGINIMYPPAPLVGATGTGTETTIINNILAAVPTGSTVIIPSGKTFTVSQVTLNVPEVTLTGGGTIKGSLFIGAKTGGQNKLNIKIDNIIFDQGTLTTGTSGIELGKSRIVTITRCVFRNIDKAIYVAPDQNYGFHDISQIKIFKNQFEAVNYDIYADMYNDFGTNTQRWMTASDWQFINNISNIAVITSVWISAIDGINIANNTFFTGTDTSSNTKKEKGVYIGYSDWVNIVNNHFFVTGWEAIHLDNPRDYVITDNQFAACGSREPRSTILITGSNNEKGVIADNNLSSITLHGIDLESTGTGMVSVKDNNVHYDSASTSYIGSTALNSITHHPVYQVYATSVTCAEGGTEINSATHIQNNIKKRYGSSVRTTKRSHLAGTFISQVFSATTTAYNLVELGAISGSKANYDGLVYINARQGDLDSTNTSSYVLHVSKSGAGNACTLMNDEGLTTGASASHPSFTFSLDGTNNILQATGVGATVGTFYFHISYWGNIETIK